MVVNDECVNIKDRYMIANDRHVNINDRYIGANDSCVNINDRYIGANDGRLGAAPCRLRLCIGRMLRCNVLPG